MSLDAKIDDLYRQPLDAFVPSRNALAKTLTGADAAQVRALAKPTVVPWAVNQVYWQARPTYDKVIKSGERLRAAQIASLEGRRGGDVREAGDTHRRALADAAKEAERLAAKVGAKPAADALMRTFEALSLASEAPEPAGRLTKPLQPSGFEALAGVTPVARPFPASARLETRASAGGPERAALRPGVQPARSEGDRRKERAAAEAARKQAVEVKKAEATLARAEEAERRAREVWDRAHDELLEARQRLTQLKKGAAES